MRTGEQFLIIDVIFCPWNHLKDIKELLLAQLDELPELIGAILLSVSRLVVDRQPSHENGLLCESFQILLVLEGHLRRRSHGLLLITHCELRVVSDCLQLLRFLLWLADYVALSVLLKWPGGLGHDQGLGGHVCDILRDLLHRHCALDCWSHLQEWFASVLFPDP